MRSFDVVADQPQYPCEAREIVTNRCHAYRGARTVLLDEARTARLLLLSSGRRLSPLYGRDLERVHRDMALERAIYWKARHEYGVTR
jgi:hypothetical protein